MQFGGEIEKRVVGGVVSQPTISERLKDEKRRLETRLTEVNKALEALQKNPEIAEVINIISKVRY